MVSGSTGVHMRSKKLLPAGGIAAIVGMVLWMPSALGQANFEKLPRFEPKEVLKNVAPKTDLYEIDPLVTNNGVMNEFHIRTDYGIVRVVGNERVPESIREIQAIAYLDQVRASEMYVDGIRAAGKSSLNNIKTLVTKPVGTISAIPAGVERFLGNAYRAAKRDGKSQYEDSTVKEVLGFSRVKRSLASDLGVDPYSSNAKLQDALDDVAWASYAGGMSLKVGGAFAVPSPADAVIASTQVAINASQLVKCESPENLRKINTDKLKAIGASTQQIDGLLNSSWFSPTRQTILAECLSQMRGVENVAAYLDWATDATSEDQAFAIQRSAELLQNYHSKTAPLSRIYLAGALPVAETKDGNVVLALAFDYLVWTEKVHDTAEAIRGDLPVRLKDKPVVLVTRGQVSPKATAGLKELNYTVHTEETKAAAK